MKASKLTLKLIACAAAALAFSAPVAAQVYTDRLDTTVSVTFTPKCYFNTVAGTLTLSTSYTAFQTGAATASATPAVECSNGVTIPTYAFSGSTTTPAAGAFSASATTYEGLVKGLAYVLTATPATVAGGAAGSVSAGVATGATANTGTVGLGLSIAGGQPGDTGGSATDIAYLFVAF
jgi:hypothetical protein